VTIVAQRNNLKNPQRETVEKLMSKTRSQRKENHMIRDIRNLDSVVAAKKNKKNTSLVIIVQIVSNDAVL